MSDSGGVQARGHTAIDRRHQQRPARNHARGQHAKKNRSDFGSVLAMVGMVRWPESAPRRHPAGKIMKGITHEKQTARARALSIAARCGPAQWMTQRPHSAISRRFGKTAPTSVRTDQQRIARPRFRMSAPSADSVTRRGAFGGYRLLPKPASGGARGGAGTGSNWRRQLQRGVSPSPPPPPTACSLGIISNPRGSLDLVPRIESAAAEPARRVATCAPNRGHVLALRSGNCCAPSETSGAPTSRPRATTSRALGARLMGALLDLGSAIWVGEFDADVFGSVGSVLTVGGRATLIVHRKSKVPTGRAVGIFSTHARRGRCDYEYRFTDVHVERKR